ncbi:MAG: Eco57I restriction-modification methylase domain-containing protein, partial [Aridibacter sp.]
MIDVLVVYLKRETTLERGRSTMRNFAADFLTQRQKDAVLVAFVSPTEKDWRFSFVKLETYLEDSRRELTPAKRSSFLVGKNEKSHTAQTQFLPILQQTTDPTLADIETAFNIEKVTKEFFGRYKELYEKVRDAIAECCAKDAKVCSEFLANGMFTFAKDEKGNEKLDADGHRIKIPNSDDFAKKLLGQIVFLYFLQRKGWFGVERDKAWGTGDKNFLRSLFENRANYKSHKLSRDLNFYEDILEPLFYNTLAIKRDGDWSDRFYCKIPFLNGGLFEPIYGYNWSNNELLLPETLFSNKQNESDEGTGILDVFDLYNFTINEAEPLEVEVAVDPEMLGKIFENLLPENIRHGSGTYYTPRVIVAYMCQQSLINYLITHLPDIPRSDIESFIRFGSQQKDFTEADTQAHQDKFLPEAIRNESKKIDELLRKITVCDPAIGSGAFPVGMMQEIVKARMALYSSEKTPKPENETADEKASRLQTESKAEQKKHYEIKRQTIENSLYGVDIDAGAVEIAKLRLWLSLIVDEANFQNIEPLPNLDYKIMQGNSLLDEFHGVKLIDDKLFKAFDKEARIEEIRAKIAQYEKDLGKANVGRQSAIYELTRKRIEELNRQKKQLIEGDSSSQFGLFAEEDESQKKLEHLKAKIKEFFGKTNQNEKKKLREEIDRLEWEFIEAKLKADDKTDELAALAEANKERRKNYFLWQLNFPEIFQAGGFDVVIGNPPYIKEYTQKSAFDGLRSSPYYQGKMDIWYLFACNGIDLTKNDGLLCFIATNNWTTNAGASKMRNKIINDAKIGMMLDFGSYMIFESASIQTMVMLFQNDKKRDDYRFDYRNLQGSDIEMSDVLKLIEKIPNEKVNILSPKIKRSSFIDKFLTFSEKETENILEKIKKMKNLSLDENSEVAQGIVMPQDF